MNFVNMLSWYLLILYSVFVTVVLLHLDEADSFINQLIGG